MCRLHRDDAHSHEDAAFSKSCILGTVWKKVAFSVAANHPSSKWTVRQIVLKNVFIYKEVAQLGKSCDLNYSTENEERHPKSL